MQERKLATKNYLPLIASSITNTLNESNLKIQSINDRSEGKYIGKVRDRYNYESSHMILVTTDRLTAFDRKVTAIWNNMY